MNGLKTLVFSTIAMAMGMTASPAGEPGKNGFSMDFSEIAGVTPYVRFGGGGGGGGGSGGGGGAGDADGTGFSEIAPSDLIGVGARIALSHRAGLSFGYSLLVAPPGTAGQGDPAPAHSLILGFDYKF